MTCLHFSDIPMSKILALHYWYKNYLLTYYYNVVSCVQIVKVRTTSTVYCQFCSNWTILTYPYWVTQKQWCR